MTMHKAYAAEFKALPDSQGRDTGRFTARVSVFRNVDSMGDRVMEGAFDDTLLKWKGSGDNIPVIWSHDWGNPFAHIGVVTDAYTDEKGLVVEGELDLSNAFAAQVYNLMKRRAVKEFSFGYQIVKESPADDGANNLEALDIIEVGPTLKGANPSTELLGVKAELEAAADPTSITELQKAVAALKAEVAELKNTSAVAAKTTEEATDNEGESPTDNEPLSEIELLRLELDAALNGSLERN
jgi:HK97 family phage prohead protease